MVGRGLIRASSFEIGDVIRRPQREHALGGGYRVSELQIHVKGRSVGSPLAQQVSAAAASISEPERIPVGCIECGGSSRDSLNLQVCLLEGILSSAQIQHVGSRLIATYFLNLPNSRPNTMARQPYQIAVGVRFASRPLSSIATEP